MTAFIISDHLSNITGSHQIKGSKDFHQWNTEIPEILSSFDCCNAQDMGNKEKGEVVHHPYRFDGHKYTHVLSGHLDFLLLKKKKKG